MSSECDKAILNCIFNPLLPIGEYVYNEELPNNLKDPEDISSNAKDAQHFEMEGVKAAENGDIKYAVELFTKAINLSPLKASIYNNRAQAYRLLHQDEDALTDLDMAIKLSNGHGRSGCQALCQKGIIKRKQGDDEQAIANFKIAAALGSEFAKMQLVELNPYAALCNKMLHDVMAKLNAGES